MQIVPLADAKNNLSRLVDEVADGHEIIIAKHGRPMARLVPMGKALTLRFGLLKGELVVPCDVGEELPESVLAGFGGRA